MGGGRHCCVNGCESRHRKGVEQQNVQFYKLPSASSKEGEQYEKLGNLRRKAWLEALSTSLAVLNPDNNIENLRICSKHFASGRKATLTDRESEDWVPHLLMGSSKGLNPLSPRIGLTTKLSVEFLDIADTLPMSVEDTKSKKLVSDESKQPKKTNQSYPYCIACQEYFTTTKYLMRHMEEKHTYSSKDCTKSETLTAKQKMNEIFERLEKFDWCTCDHCLMHCQLFFNHITNNHCSKAVGNDDHAYNELTPFKKQKVENLCVELIDDEDIDYFECTDINLKLKSDATLEAISESDNTLMDKNSKKMFSLGKISTYPEGLEHIETLQLETVFDPVEDSENGEFVSDDFLVEQLATPKFPVEYQCSLCGNIYKSIATVKRCLENHVNNGWKEGEPVEIERNDANLIIDHHNILAITPLRADYLQKPTNIKRTAPAQHHSTDEHTATNIPKEIPRLLDHISNSTIIKCDPCEVYFKTATQFRLHSNNAHGKNFIFIETTAVKIRRSIKCTLCCENQTESVSFKTLEEGLQHRFEKHSITVDLANRAPKPRIIVQPDGLEYQEGPNDVRLVRQNGIAEEYQCICDLRCSRKQVVEKCLAHHIGLRRFKCMKFKKYCDDPCGMQFFTELELNQHDFRIHLTEACDEKKAICDTCGINVPKRAMALHKHSHKMEDSGPQTCETCGKILASARRLREHIRRVHKKVKKFHCSICYERFIYRTSADLCMAKHSGVKTVECECGQFFLTKAQRSAHRLTAHIQIGEFFCELCGLYFRTDKQLEKHLTVHTTQ